MKTGGLAWAKAVPNLAYSPVRQRLVVIVFEQAVADEVVISQLRHSSRRDERL